MAVEPREKWAPLMGTVPIQLDPFHQKQKMNEELKTGLYFSRPKFILVSLFLLSLLCNGFHKVCLPSNLCVKSLQASAQTQKATAINELQQHYYEKSLKSFNLALLLHPEDRSSANFKRSVKSHQVVAYFNLKKYREALEVGEQSYKSNPSLKFTVRLSLLSNLVHNQKGVTCSFRSKKVLIPPPPPPISFPDYPQHCVHWYLFIHLSVGKQCQKATRDQDYSHKPLN